MRAKRGFALALALAILCFAPSLIHAANFTATLDRDTVTLGESATLTLTFEGGSPKNIPAIPAIPNLQVAYGAQSSQFSFNNGQTTSSVTYRFALTPLQPGEFNIPALKIEVDGKLLSSQPLKFKAVGANAPTPSASGTEDQLAFVKLVVPKKEIYVGEVVPVELQIHLRNVVQNIHKFQMSPPKADGFTVGKTVETQHRQVRVGNGVFNVVPLTMTLSAFKAGQLALGPITCTMVLQLPISNPRTRDQLDPFGLLQRPELKPVTLSTEAETLRVLPLPKQNMPADFNGAVGNYSLTVSAAPTNVAVGDPITVRIQISGRGLLDSLALPAQTAWREFKTYPPTSKVETADQLGLQGNKTFEQVVVPQNAEVKELPPLSFSFFDPDQKRYRALTNPALALVVRPGGASPAPTVLSPASSESARPTQDIVHIKPRLGVVGEIRPPLVQQAWFLALQGIPVLAWASLLARRKLSERLANNPRLRRQRRVVQLVRAGLHDLRRFANANRAEDFFATAFRLLQEQLGERLDLPASAITEAVVDERLRPRDVPAETLALVHELFQTCNQARYAPQRTHQELLSLIPKVETALSDLQKIKV